MCSSDLVRAASLPVEVRSAGTGAWEGAPASEGSYLVALERGLDLSGHRARLLAEGADIVTFTSSSTVNNFCKLVDAKKLSTTFVSIGPQTTAAAEANGLKVAIEATPHTIPGLVEAVLKL